MRKIFNPFSKASGRYGAPMGRHWDDLSDLRAHTPDFAIIIEHCGGDGYYDRGGVYWGHSGVYAAFTIGGEFCTYLSAKSLYDAAKQVRDVADEEVTIQFVKRKGFHVKLYDNAGEAQWAD